MGPVSGRIRLLSTDDTSDRSATLSKSPAVTTTLLDWLCTEGSGPVGIIVTVIGSE